MPIEYDPEELVALNVECGNHPDVMLRVQEVLMRSGLNPDDPTNIYTRIATIAACCGIDMPPKQYTRSEILKICQQCYTHLRAKRIGIVVAAPQ